MRHLLAFCFITLSTQAYASFVSDFVSDVNNNLGAEYYSTQERGYVTFGSYSKRTPNVTINPVSITPPSISVGCNGIDVVTGGISFLKKDALVNMYKQLTDPSTMTYIGVSIGMKMLTNELADTVESAQDLIQKINAMQLDSCAIANGAVTFVTDSGYRENLLKFASRAEDKAASGDRDNYDDAVKSQSLTSDRDSHIQATIPQYSGKDYLLQGGSLIQYIYNTWSGAGNSSDTFAFPSKMDVNRVRALYGDAYYDPNDLEMMRYIPPCEYTLNDLTQALYTKGTTINAKCEVINEQSLSLYVDDQMTKIFDAMTGNGGNIDEQFINAIQGSNILMLIRADSGAKDQLYLQNTVNYLRTLAKIELAYRYTDIYYQHFISQLKIFGEDAAVNAKDYGIPLYNKIQQITHEANIQYSRFKEEYDLAVGQAYQFMLNKRDLEQQKQRGSNLIVNAFRGGL